MITSRACSGTTNVGQDEAAPGAHDGVHPREQVGLGRPQEMVDRQDGDHQVEWAGRQRILELGEAQAHPLRRQPPLRRVQHGSAGVNADQVGVWMCVQDPLGGLTGAGAQLEDPLG